jgi:hypothetical protein
MKEETTLTVYDAESQKLTKVTPEMKHLATEMMQHLQAASVMMSVALARMVDEKLFLALGFSSAREFIETTLPFSKSTAYRITDQGRLYLKAYPILQGSVPPAGHIESSQSVPPAGHMTEADLPENLLLFHAIGTEKMNELKHIEDIDFEEVLHNGHVVMSDGQEFTLEEIRNISKRELRALIKEKRGSDRRYRERITRLEEKNKQLKSEMKLTQDELQKQEGQILDAREIDRLYQRRHRTYSEQLEMLREAEDFIFKARGRVINANITKESNLEIRELLIEVLGLANALAAAINNWYDEVLHYTSDLFELHAQTVPTQEQVMGFVADARNRRKNGEAKDEE